MKNAEGPWITGDGGPALAQCAKEIKGKNILFFTKDIMHVFQLSAAFDKHGLVLMDATEIQEIEEKSNTAKIALYIVEDVDLTAEERQKLSRFQPIVWIGGAQEDALALPLQEKQLMEKIKNALAHV